MRRQENDDDGENMGKSRFLSIRTEFSSEVVRYQTQCGKFFSEIRNAHA